ncbi:MULTISPECIES: glucose-1-phosphate adenylyltransferase subunit GlgD [Allofournierella]|uniref:Glucose-1-phosphate adenylyltransferase subunit GlgD n=1 Tax=Allofournierella massiliensis TaxID=1650663 RepID=A0ABT7UTY9_9FIRM|nr:glucose-1-phosphate adenylyltransferase subunit GlgD [Fournierella massiliensis]MDM8202353.1 glucose-1-phosphate adenylyltransferase subunit GlgD [Fournierella massiliensis]OUN16535.1 glucose-1-phosphate adenylyltransferase subunit GlgD [Gemmiger sp. An87]
MVKSNTDALGIIFPNAHDSLVQELVAERTMASVPFGGRYRLIDFVLSSMVNSGISNVSIVVKQNYHSLMDHLGSGREWDLTRKRGGLNLVPPYAEANVKLYRGRVEALASLVEFLEDQKEEFVIMSDSDVAFNFDFNELIAAHVASQADVTVMYQRSVIPQGLKEDNYTLKLQDGRVTELLTNDYRPGVQNLSMNVYIIQRESLIAMIKDASIRGLLYFEKDILARNLELLNVQGFEYTGYTARIADRKSYFEENMRLLDPKNLDALFPEDKPVYTKVHDNAPTRYAMDCQVKNSMVADGCIIEGEVENCVLFRGVKVKKGAKVKNCVLMQNTVVEAGAEVEYAVTDKNVKITADKKLSGTDTFPVYVAKGHTV